MGRFSLGGAFGKLETDYQKLIYSSPIAFDERLICSQLVQQ